MGTRALTIVTDGESEIVVMYSQYDGYPDGHGAELASFLDGMRVVNGLGVGVDDCKVANGAGCLAAQLVAAFKTEPGGIYLHPAGTRNCWEEYRYFITADPNRLIAIRVEDGSGRELFSGDVKEFASWCEEGDPEDRD